MSRRTRRREQTSKQATATTKEPQRRQNSWKRRQFFSLPPSFRNRSRIGRRLDAVGLLLRALALVFFFFLLLRDMCAGEKMPPSALVCCIASFHACVLFRASSSYRSACSVLFSLFCCSCCSSSSSSFLLFLFCVRCALFLVVTDMIGLRAGEQRRAVLRRSCVPWLASTLLQCEGRVFVCLRQYGSGCAGSIGSPKKRKRKQKRASKGCNSLRGHAKRECRA